MLLVGVAGQAMANFFDETHLIRVVYNLNGEKEVMTDLGAGYNYTIPSGQTTKLDQNNFSLEQLHINDWSSVYVAYFVQTTSGISGANAFWFSGNAGGLNVKSRQWSSTGSATWSVTLNNGMTGNAQNINTQDWDYAYSWLIGQDGDHFGIATTPTVHKNLSGFAAEGDQYVDQYLYYFATPNLASAGLQVATIRTFEDGHTELNPVPVPAAIYLLGSGLLALVGIRRKTNLEA
jgi:hypothetical protein